MTRAREVGSTGTAAGGGGSQRPKDAVQSLERAVAVLTAFDAAHPSLTLTEVAERCRMPRSAARRFLHTLMELGFVEMSGRHFFLTPQVLTLGYANVGRFSLADVCRPHLEALAATLHTSASVSVLDGPDVRYVSRVDVAAGMSVSLKAGSRVPAHLTAAGRVLLSLLPDEDLVRYLDGAATPGGAYLLSAIDRERLEADVTTVRQQGWASADQVLDVGVQAVAVPLRSRTGRGVGALTVSSYEGQKPTSKLVSRVLPELLHTAGTISLELRAGIEM